MHACRRTRSREARSPPRRDQQARPHQKQPGLLARIRRAPRLGVFIVAAAAFAVEMAVSARYGYHRDELYFLAAGQHPAFGYVDQPPLTPLLARLLPCCSPTPLAGLRVLPALALGALVAAHRARSAGISARAAPGQLLAALATASCAEYLGAMHLLTTTTPDFVAWAGLLYLVLRLLDSGEPRWWLAIGLVTGHRGRGQVDDRVPGRGGGGRVRASPRSGGCCAAGSCCWARSSPRRWPRRT